MPKNGDEEPRLIEAIDSNGRTISIADAHRGDRKRFVVRAVKILAPFLQLESAICAGVNYLDKLGEIFPEIAAMKICSCAMPWF